MRGQAAGSPLHGLTSRAANARFLCMARTAMRNFLQQRRNKAVTVCALRDLNT